MAPPGAKYVNGKVVSGSGRSTAKRPDKSGFSDKYIPGYVSGAKKFGGTYQQLIQDRRWSKPDFGKGENGPGIPFRTRSVTVPKVGKKIVKRGKKKVPTKVYPKAPKWTPMKNWSNIKNEAQPGVDMRVEAIRRRLEAGING